MFKNLSLSLSLLIIGTFSIPSLSQAYVFNNQLDIGDRGEDVSALQQTLTNLNHFSYPTITGYFGHVTQTAVQLFQSARGIVSSGTPESTGYGRVGPMTLTALNSIQGSGVTTSTLLELLRVVQARIAELRGNAPTNPDLASPSNVTASHGNDEITIKWSEVFEAQFYLVQRKEYGGTYQNIATTTDTTFIDTDISRNTRYYYTVTAENNDGRSVSSEYAYVYLSGGGGGSGSSNNEDAEEGCQIDASGYDIYVDSENGSDTNSGTGPCDAFAALQTATAVATSTGDGVKVALARGSHWREQFNLASLENITIEGYGSGNLPIINGSDIVTSWSLTSGQSNTYETEVIHNSSGTNRLTVYEDGILLTRVTNVSTAESTPGSFVDIKGSDGSPVTVYIHPSDDGNPTSNGKIYEVSTRLTAFAGGAGATISGLETSKAISNNGSMDLVSRTNANVSQVLASWGTKHNLGIGSGQISDSIAFGFDDVTSYEPSVVPIVAFLQDASTSDVVLNRVFVVNADTNQPTGITAFYAHDSDINGGFSTFSATQSAAIGVLSAGTPRARTVIWDGLYNDRVSQLPSAASTDTDIVEIRRLQAKLSAQTLTPVSTVNGLEMTYENSVILSTPASGYTSELFRISGAGPFNLLKNVLYTDRTAGVGQRGFMNVVSAAATGTINVEQTVFDGNVTFLYQISVPSGWNYTGDYNVFYHVSGTPFRSQFNGSAFTTLASWQATTTQDVNSVYLAGADQYVGNTNAFWLGWSGATSGTATSTVGPAAGDFRVNPNARVYGSGGTAYIGTFADGTTPITEAGPQNHWDWNAREAVSGAPAAWPNVPDTLEESKEYLLDPESWEFYP
ncbi:hypothetical protein COU14_02550 [Candidatus Kaiserbacteria bacterium CG10_big_fil_rev_8_21_14_0_10_44_10]|uniref:Fibronectin type-III domain-containing protein n=1 Tax=Candidatus Kaiserbacteria bacterium CG10_big_fil_rev_8_21_14_0_10_44_10 TaxID=1974606 RepID=A0A2H0UH96_9BACT|nr:MAG: hypothetical protein COU14_02550 [Candidatus Kaiserbacteria bacterium CG10_big_fil_rev_8_21_14_0_10_44_10]